MGQKRTLGKTYAIGGSAARNKTVGRGEREGARGGEREEVGAR